MSAITVHVRCGRCVCMSVCVYVCMSLVQLCVPSTNPGAAMMPCMHASVHTPDEIARKLTNQVTKRDGDQ